MRKNYVLDSFCKSRLTCSFLFSSRFWVILVRLKKKLLMWLDARDFLWPNVLSLSRDFYFLLLASNFRTSWSRPTTCAQMVTWLSAKEMTTRTSFRSSLGRLLLWICLMEAFPRAACRGLMTLNLFRSGSWKGEVPSRGHCNAFVRTTSLPERCSSGCHAKMVRLVSVAVILTRPSGKK